MDNVVVGAHHVVALVIPEVVAFDLAIPAQVFGHHLEGERYRFTVCTERPGEVRTSTGYSVTAGSGLEALDSADTVVVPGFHPPDRPPRWAVDALRRAADRGTRIATVCIGAFALAATGLLDGRTATTHWQYGDHFQQLFPRVRLNADILYADQGQFLTSAGLSAGIDLCLYLVRADYGAHVAAETARRMVVATHRTGGQTQYARRLLAPDGLQNAMAWAVGEMHRPLTVPQLARHAGMTPRTFTRRFTDDIGMAPMRWLNGQRVQEAQRLLEATSLSVDAIAEYCGFGSAGVLRTHLRRLTGDTPTQYRHDRCQ